MARGGVNAYLRDDVTFLRTQYAYLVTPDSCESVTSTPVKSDRRHVINSTSIGKSKPSNKPFCK